MHKNMTRITLVICQVALVGLASAQNATSPQAAPVNLTVKPAVTGIIQPVRPLVRVKLEQPTIQRVEISPTTLTAIKVPEPTVLEKVDQPLDLKSPLLSLTVRDQVDPRKYGFSDMNALKASTRKSLGLPQDFPISIREQVDTKYGQREGLVVTGVNPLLLDARGQSLSVESFRQKLTKDAGSVVGKPRQP